MKYGYGRVSTQHQELDAQIKALKHAGAEKIITEKVSKKIRKGRTSRFIKAASRRRHTYHY